MTDARKALLARNAYEGYCTHTGWKSLATGQNLPNWSGLTQAAREAWGAAAATLFVEGSDGKDYLIDDPNIPG
jgi:hypothetical protein